MGRIFFLVVLSVVFLSGLGLAWENEDCACDLGMKEGMQKGQGNSASCSWSDQSSSLSSRRITMKVYDQVVDYSKAVENLEAGKKEMKKKLEGNKNFEQAEDESSYVVFYQEGDTFYGWARYIRETGYEFTVFLDEFKSMTEVKEKLSSLEPCIERMVQDRLEEKSLYRTVEKDEATPGSKGISYVEEHGSFFWNLRNWFNGLLGKETPMPWVESAIAEIGAEECLEKTVSARSQCFHTRAIESGNYLVCEESYDPAKCYASVASIKKDPLICDKLRDYVKWGRKKLLSACYDWLSTEQTDVEVCLKYPYQQEMHNCFLEVAKNTGDAEVCDRLKHPDRCKVCAHLTSKDPAICETIQDKEAKKACEFESVGRTYCTGIGRLFSDTHIPTTGSGAARG